MIGALARSNPGPNLDANQVVLARRAASTSSSVGLGLFDGKPTRRRASAEERKRRGRTERVRHQRASERDTRHVDMSHAELTRVADRNPGHDRTVTNSYPSLRNIPYQLCETPLVQLARRCQRWRRVSVRGSSSRTSQLTAAARSRVGSISAQRDRVGVAVARVRVPPTRPMSSASPRGLHVGMSPFRACGRPEMR